MLDNPEIDRESLSDRYSTHTVYNIILFPRYLNPKVERE